MTEVFNKKSSTQLRRGLRRLSPKPEHIIWNRLRNRQLENFKFRRQFGVGKYIVDFYCPQAKLAIEIDGESHDRANAQLQDKVRQQEIEALGMRFLRFTNREVMENTEGVIEEIVKHLR